MEHVDDSQTELKRKELYNAVFAMAMKLTGSQAQAGDLTQTVFERLASTRPLEPTASRDDSVRHALGILKSVLSAERASARSERTRERVAGNQWVEGSTAGYSAEAVTLEHANRIDEQELASRHVAALRARLVDHPLELTVLDCMKDGTTKSAAIAAKLECKVIEIYKAVKRIRRYMDSIVAAERDRGEEVSHVQAD